MRVCAGVPGCAQVCTGVHKCAQVYPGVCGHAWVFGGWVRVWERVRRCVRVCMIGHDWVCVDLHWGTHVCVG